MDKELPLKPGDIDRAVSLIEVAAVYLLDGAPNTALARLQEALPIIEAAAQTRNALFGQPQKGGAA